MESATAKKIYKKNDFTIGTIVKKEKLVLEVVLHAKTHVLWKEI